MVQQNAKISLATSSVILALLAALFFWLGYDAYNKELGTENWEPAQAIATSADPVRKTGTKNTHYWEVYVKYDYQVGQSSYRGQGFYTGLNPYRSEEEAAQAFHAGKKTIVYYNPKNPAQSAMQINPELKTHYLHLGLGFLVLLFIPAIIVYHRHMYKQK